MSLKSNTKGFTIVELLIVIVVIGILAAITIVAFNGIQNRGKSASAQSAASNAVKKAEVYNTDPDTTGYPVNGPALTTAAASSTYKLDGVTWNSPSATANPNVLSFYKCGTGSTTTAPTTAAGVTTQTGVRIDYYKYDGTVGVQSISTGQTTGLVGSNNVGCGIANT